MKTTTTRRSALLAGLWATSSLALTGCMARRSQTAGDTLPGPIWPHDREPKVAEAPRRTAPNRPASSISVRPRRNWTAAQPIVAETNPMVRVERLTVHHDGLDPVQITTADQAADRIEYIRKSHVDGRGWADIGYHYIVDPQGRVWEGRPIRLQGAHVRDNNPRNAGVLVLGHFDLQQPTPAALRSLDTTLAELCRVHGVRLNAIRTHREYNPTQCPGEYLQHHMDRTRSAGGSLARRLRLT